MCVCVCARAHHSSHSHQSYTRSWLKLFNLESSVTCGDYSLHLKYHVNVEHTAATAFSNKVFSAVTFALASIQSFMKSPKRISPFFPRLNTQDIGIAMALFLFHFTQSSNSTGSSISINWFLGLARYLFGGALQGRGIWALWSTLLAASTSLLLPLFVNLTAGLCPTSTALADVEFFHPCWSSAVFLEFWVCSGWCLVFCFGRGVCVCSYPKKAIYKQQCNLVASKASFFFNSSQKNCLKFSNVTVTKICLVWCIGWCPWTGLVLLSL